jgi:hypothetical protein
VQVDLTKTSAARSDTAFAIIANVADWPRIVNLIKSVEVLTPGPIRSGTRLREERISFGHDSMQEMEVVTIDPPRRLCLFVEHPGFHFELDCLVDGIYGGGCRMSLIFRSRVSSEVQHAAYPLTRSN